LKGQAILRNDIGSGEISGKMNLITSRRNAGRNGRADLLYPSSGLQFTAFLPILKSPKR
jgi:hypothetical protein